MFIIWMLSCIWLVGTGIAIAIRSRSGTVDPVFFCRTRVLFSGARGVRGSPRPSPALTNRTIPQHFIRHGYQPFAMLTPSGMSVVLLEMQGADADLDLLCIVAPDLLDVRPANSRRPAWSLKWSGIWSADNDGSIAIAIMDDMRLLDWMRAWMRPCPAVTGRRCGNRREDQPMMCGIYVGWNLLTACVDCGHQAVHFVHGCFLCCFSCVLWAIGII